MTMIESGEVCDGCGKLLICRNCGKFRSPSAAQSVGMREALVSAQRIIERDFPNGQLAIDIRNALAQPSPVGSHGDGYCGCTERCRDRDNCQYDVKPASQPSPTVPVEECPRPVIPDHSAKACVESGNCGCGAKLPAAPVDDCPACHGDGYFPKEDLSGDTKCEACEGTGLPSLSAANEDVRWAVNYLLEQIAAKFEAWETFDLFRSEAAATVRGFKHDLIAHGAQNLAQDAEKGTTLDTARVTQILERHIKLDWLNASDGKPDIVGIEEAAAELLRGGPQGARKS